jgi:hypothetical protein
MMTNRPEVLMTLHCKDLYSYVINVGCEVDSEPGLPACHHSPNGLLTGGSNTNRY